MARKKSITAEYIESGTFQGGEEDVSKAGIEYGEEVVILKKAEYERLKDLAWRYEELSK
jgi:hypothetical protein